MLQPGLTGRIAAVCLSVTANQGPSVTGTDVSSSLDVVHSEKMHIFSSD